MKINFSILLLVLLSFSACKQRVATNDVDTDIDTTAVSTDVNDTSSIAEIKLPKEIEVVFDAWLKNEIKEGNLLEECPGEFGSKEYQKFNENHKSKSVNIGGKFIESNRWAFFGLSNVFYYDFNKDGKEDVLIIGDLGQDCLAGNGYVGDPEVTIVILSKGDKYFVDNSLLDKFYKSLGTSKANKAINKGMKNLAYVSVIGVKDGSIFGKYETWDNDEFAGNDIMQFRGNFSYDITKNSTTISSEEKIQYSE